MKNKTRKILDFLTQDIHLKHNYYLIGGILIILALVGYTSYSLFSYEVLSPSIYVSFKDSEKPVCVIGEPAVSLMEKSSTTTFEMNCTDNYTVADKDLTSSDFTKTGDIIITGVTKEKVGKAMKYIITITSGTTGGVASIKLNADAVTDTAGNGNAVSNTSEVFVRVTCDAMEEDVSGANSPEVSLASNMIPVCYNSTLNLWVKADSTNTNTDYPWYSYSGKTWANAVTVTETNRQTYLNAESGMPISMSDINTMWVWIPRFSAKMVEGQAGEYTSTAYCSKSNYSTEDYCIRSGYTWYPVGYNSPGAFDVMFVDKDTIAHDAFTFGEQNLSGLWIGKFENTKYVSETCTPANNSAVGSGCNLNTIRPKIRPFEPIWRGASVSTFFSAIQKMIDSGNQYGFDKSIDITLDTHMLKNNEWGAVAYLTQSIYGRCTSSTSCSEIGINNYTGFFTGSGASAGSRYSSNLYQYYTTNGKIASTTGNIYGVYDMSGGSYEYVMGNYNSTKKNDQFTTLPNIKYYNVYTTESAYTSSGLQHALTETKNWYGDNAYFVSANDPWFIRGGTYSASTIAGIFFFYYSSNGGGSDIYQGSRSCLLKY